MKKVLFILLLLTAFICVDYVSPPDNYLSKIVYSATTTDAHIYDSVSNTVFPEPDKPGINFSDYPPSMVAAAFIIFLMIMIAII